MVDDPNEPETKPLEAVAMGLALAAMFASAAVLYVLDVSWWWMAFPFGGALVALASAGASWYVDYRAYERSTRDQQQEALDELRGRYARGELTEAEFEDRLERLLETETVEDARESNRRSQRPEREPEFE